MRFLVGAWLFCLIGYILTGCSVSVGSKPPESVLSKYKIINGNNIYICKRIDYSTHGYYNATDCYEWHTNNKISQLISVTHIEIIEE